MKKCANHYQKCEKEVASNRKKFCCDSCKWWYNNIKRQKESHLPPVKKRTKEYFSMVVGSERANKRSGQGRRSGGMVRGSMSDIFIMVAIEEVVEFNEENARKHFAGIPGHLPTSLRLGDGTRLEKREVESHFGIKIV